MIKSSLDIAALVVHGLLNLKLTYVQAYGVLVGACKIHDFPFFCGALVAGYNFLRLPLLVIFEKILKYLQRHKWRGRRPVVVTASRFVAAFTSAWLSLCLLNTSKESQPRRSSSGGSPNGSLQREKHVQKASEAFEASEADTGGSMDLTLFAVSRGVETVVHEFWVRRKASRIRQKKWNTMESLISHYADASIFAVSAGTVMWAWFYLPNKLPRAYNNWIKSAAQVDQRLIEALRRVRRGEFVYGEDTGQAPLLQSMCGEYDWPLDWGDPAKVIPIPCEMVHMGAGRSCHWHAIVRFGKAFRFALAMYLPLQLLLRASHPSVEGLWKAFREAIRSSTFLGAFVSLFYYGVCLSRTRLGPKIFSKETVTPTMWDSGLCVRAGCLLCGWSILLEAEKRRQELAMFVVPRAAATLFPRRYSKRVSWYFQSRDERKLM